MKHTLTPLLRRPLTKTVDWVSVNTERNNRYGPYDHQRHEAPRLMGKVVSLCSPSASLNSTQQIFNRHTNVWTEQHMTCWGHSLDLDEWMFDWHVGERRSLWWYVGRLLPHQTQRALQHWQEVVCRNRKQNSVQNKESDKRNSNQKVKQKQNQPAEFSLTSPGPFLLYTYYTVYMYIYSMYIYTHIYQ